MLSPIVLNVYFEKIFRITLEGETHVIKINGAPINNIRYAGDTVIVAKKIENFQILIDAGIVSVKNMAHERRKNKSYDCDSATNQQ